MCVTRVEGGVGCGVVDESEEGSERGSGVWLLLVLVYLRKGF